MRNVILLTLIFIIPAAIFAINSNASEYGFQFLQIPVNPIASALAGNGIYWTNYSGGLTERSIFFRS